MDAVSLGLGWACDSALLECSLVMSWPLVLGPHLGGKELVRLLFAINAAGSHLAE